MFIFNKAKTVAVLLAEFGGAEGPGGLGPEDPRLVPLQTLLKNRGAQLEEFDNRHVLAAFESTDTAVEAARELHLALISTEPARPAPRVRWASWSIMWRGSPIRWRLC
jgi:hypothetical protein